MRSSLSASSCFLLNIHAPPCSLVPKTHDIKSCFTTSSGEGRTINGAHFIGSTHWNFPHVAAFVVSLEKKGKISTPVVVLFLLNVFVLTPDARVFLITGNIPGCDAEPADSSLRPNRTFYT